MPTEPISLTGKLSCQDGLDIHVYRSTPGNTASSGPHQRFCRILWCWLWLLAMPASIVAEALPERFETWDATTLDVKGQLRSLNGTWDYQPWSRLDKIPPFDAPRAVTVPVAEAPGAYRTAFTVEHGPETHRTLLRFGAAAYRCAIFVNRTPVGTHAGGLTPFEFDITKALREGSNELIVLLLGREGALLHHSSGGTLAQRDFNSQAQALAKGGNKTAFGLGYFVREGIRRDVDLRQVPLLRVADVILTPSFRAKQLKAEVRLANQTGAKQPTLLQVDLFGYDIATATVGTTPLWSRQQPVPPFQGAGSATIIHDWADPALWMPGAPQLHVARVRLLTPSGKVLDERNVRFGFREVWTEGRRIIVNGKPFRAFVHGTLDTEASTEKLREKFTQLLSLGINTVRPHSMPPPPRFTLLADEMGMAIIGESEWTFNANFAFEEPVFWEHFQRLWEERIARDKNHPSILLWSLANEVIICSPGQNIGHHFHDAWLHLRKIDPTRPFMQEGDGDLRDLLPGAKGFPIDIVNLHLYDQSPTKHPLWATEFPQVAWSLETIQTPQEIPGATRFGDELPDRNRPWFVGEFGLLVSAAYPDFFSFWSGPEAYRDLFGPAEALIRATGETMTLQIQAFRDMGLAGMDPWDMPTTPAFHPYLQRALEPVTLLTRDLTAHWTSRGTATRSVTLLNDSLETHDLTATGVLKEGERVLHRQQQTFTLNPGERNISKWTFPLPATDEKKALTLAFELTDAEGRRRSGLTQPGLVYPESPPSAAWQNRRVLLVGKEANLGAIAKWAGQPLHPSVDFSQLDNASPVSLVILDKDAFQSLPPKSRAAADRYMENGGVVMALGADQIDFGTLRLTSNPDSEATRLFLLRDHFLTAGTTREDWEFWRPGHLVSRGNYPMSFDPVLETPLVAGGRNGPIYTPLVLRRIGQGALIGCRLQLNEAVGREPMAAGFLNRLSAYPDALRKEPRATSPTLLLVGHPDRTAHWSKTLAKARIPLVQTPAAPFSPARHVILLTGEATPSRDQLKQITRFVRDGGRLWLHRLTPQTAFLDHVALWTGAPLHLRPPVMWLQQLELHLEARHSPLLNGLHDNHTCWATFAWTHGDMYSVRTTPIADHVLEAPGSRSVVLLREPRFLGEWDTSPKGRTLSQEILFAVGKGRVHKTPGAGLVACSFGKGRVLLDQLRWDEVLNDPKSESADKARYFAGTLWKNLAELSGDDPPLSPRR